MTLPTHEGGESESITAAQTASPESSGEMQAVAVVAAIRRFCSLPTSYLARNVHGPLMPRIIAENLTWNRKSVRHPIFRQHCRALCKIPWTKMPEACRESCRRVFTVLEERSTMFFELMPQFLSISPFLRAAAYADAWERLPEVWYPDPNHHAAEQFWSFFEHLFVRYPIPEFLTPAWLEHGPLRSSPRDWFVHVARGGNLREAPGFPEHVTRRAAHLAMSAPSTFQISEAIRWGLVHALGGDEPLTRAVLRSRIRTHFEKDRFWLTLIEKLAASESFDPGMTGMVVDFITYLAEVHAREQRPFCLKQRSVESLCRQAVRTWNEIAAKVEKSHQLDDGAFDIQSSGHRALLLRAVVYVWLPSEDIKPIRLRRMGSCWEVVELCSAFDLLQESQRMGNCVAGYAGACLENCCRIWSLRSAPIDDQHTNTMKWNHHATVAVNPQKRTITQARGRFNEQLDNISMRAISAWCAANRLRGLPAPGLT
ncbi:MAG: hypothetical protein O3C21_07125 [Verrucomicrobia bacterium]|nr:hypothetical protein [Verrucomicrobiota bacterium]